jgi:hypothetical protein
MKMGAADYLSSFSKPGKEISNAVYHHYRSDRIVAAWRAALKPAASIFTNRKENPYEEVQ